MSNDSGKVRTHSIEVYKFGGGILTSKEAIQKVVQRIANQQEASLIVVVSAMGKTTKLLERILEQKKSGHSFTQSLASLYEFHASIIEGLPSSYQCSINESFDHWKQALETALQHAWEDPKMEHDHVVAFGERLSSMILTTYLKSQQIPHKLLEATTFIKTDNHFTEANIDWEVTQTQVCANLLPVIEKHQVIVTQGYIGSDSNNQTTTLGKEGSDYTASLLGSILNAKRVTVWKDVPGIMNADPKIFPAAIHLPHLSYAQVAEIASLGAKVIHPKTIQPLRKKGIPLYVRSIDDPNRQGTIVSSSAPPLSTPLYCLKPDLSKIIWASSKTTFQVGDVSGITEAFSSKGMCLEVIEKSSHRLMAVIERPQGEVDQMLREISGPWEVAIQWPVCLVKVQFLSNVCSIDSVLNKLGKICYAKKSETTSIYLLEDYNIPKELSKTSRA